jgi:hypothetical protein
MSPDAAGLGGWERCWHSQRSAPPALPLCCMSCSQQMLTWACCCLASTSLMLSEAKSSGSQAQVR